MTLSDHALLSGLNFLVAVIAARTLPPVDFGAFALCQSLYILALGVNRSIVSDPLVIVHSGGHREAVAQSSSAAVGAAFLVGVVVGGALVVAGLILFDGPSAGGVVAMGSCLPLLLTADSCRFAAFADSRPWVALAGDAVWLVSFAGGVAVFDLARSLPLLLWTWGLASGLAAGVTMVALRLRPVLTLGWPLKHRNIGGWLVIEHLSFASLPSITIGVLVATAGYEQAGAYRAAGVLMGPIGVVTSGAVTGALPEFSRRYRTRPHAVRAPAWVLGVLLAALVALGGLIWVLVPDSVGSSLLGESWVAASEVVPFMGLAWAGAAVATTLSVALRSVGAAARSARAAIWYALPTLGAIVVGAIIDGAHGVVLASIVPMWIGCILFDRQFRHVVKDIHLSRSGRRVLPAQGVVDG